MSHEDIKVSALLVGQNRPQIWESIDCFARQTHPNRELVIIIDDPAPEFRSRLDARAEELGNAQVHLVDAGLALGALRNESVSRADGEYLVQWDDDDLFGPERIAWQLGKMIESGSEVSYLREYIHYFIEDDLRIPCLWHNGFPGSVMFHRSVEVRYQPELKMKEDNFFKVRVRELGIPVTVLDNDPSLFTYRFHGANTFSRDHHDAVSRDHMRL